MKKNYYIIIGSIITFIPILDFFCKLGYKDTISYIYTYLGLIISIYSLSIIENVKMTLAKNKQNQCLSDFVEILNKIFDYLDGIENEEGDNDGNKGGNNYREEKFKKIKRDMRNEYDNIKAFGFIIDIEIDNSFCEGIILYPQTGEERDSNNIKRHQLENLKRGILAKLKERRGEKINERITNSF